MAYALAHGLNPPASAAQASAIVLGAPSLAYRPAVLRPIPNASEASPMLNPMTRIQAEKSSPVIEPKPLRWYLAESDPGLSTGATPSLRPGSVAHQGCYPEHQSGHREERVEEIDVSHLAFSFDTLGDNPRWPDPYAPNSALDQGLFTDRCKYFGVAGHG